MGTLFLLAHHHHAHLDHLLAPPLFLPRHQGLGHHQCGPTTAQLFRAFIDQCMELHEAGKCGNELASMAKYWTTELENKVAADCLQLHGGWGFMWETQIAKAYASARVQ